MQSPGPITESCEPISLLEKCEQLCLVLLCQYLTWVHRSAIICGMSLDIGRARNDNLGTYYALLRCMSRLVSTRLDPVGNC